MSQEASLTVAEFNQLPAAQAYAWLHGICHCRAWAEAMVARRPFRDRTQLLLAAEECWLGDEAQLLEACQGHAKIGDTQAIAKGGKTAREQGQVAHADTDTLAELARLNVEYEQRFGFIYLVCAAGRAPQALLEILKTRLNNSREQELRNAAAEQAAITRLRLTRSLS